MAFEDPSIAVPTRVRPELRHSMFRESGVGYRAEARPRWRRFLVWGPLPALRTRTSWPVGTTPPGYRGLKPPSGPGGKAASRGLGTASFALSARCLGRPRPGEATGFQGALPPELRTQARLASGQPGGHHSRRHSPAHFTELPGLLPLVPEPPPPRPPPSPAPEPPHTQRPPQPGARRWRQADLAPDAGR